LHLIVHELLVFLVILAEIEVAALHDGRAVDLAVPARDGQRHYARPHKLVVARFSASCRNLSQLMSGRPPPHGAGEGMWRSLGRRAQKAGAFLSRKLLYTAGT
jgi:hypothetical protein